jgi:hypothetical protein
MKEILAISKLEHRNIVGYKGCWVEAEELELDRLNRIAQKIKKRRHDLGSIGQIEESENDDPEVALCVELNEN